MNDICIVYRYIHIMYTIVASCQFKTTEVSLPSQEKQLSVLSSQEMAPPWTPPSKAGKINHNLGPTIWDLSLLLTSQIQQQPNHDNPIVQTLRSHYEHCEMVALACHDWAAQTTEKPFMKRGRPSFTHLTMARPSWLLVECCWHLMYNIYVNEIWNSEGLFEGGPRTSKACSIQFTDRAIENVSISSPTQG